MVVASTDSGLGAFLAEGTPCDLYSAIIGNSIKDRMTHQKPTPMTTHKLVDELDIKPYSQLYSQ